MGFLELETIGLRYFTRQKPRQRKRILFRQGNGLQQVAGENGEVEWGVYLGGFICYQTPRYEIHSTSDVRTLRFSTHGR